MADSDASSRASDSDLPPQGELVRGIGLVQATSLNVANMVGVGPFITIPLFVAAMGGPQALVGWIVAAVLVLCDGLVWSELGAALPGSGGTYHFLREIYGRYSLGRLIAFLFIWQFLISGTLELASGYIGGADYLAYAFQGLPSTLADWGVSKPLNACAAVAALVVAIALCRNIRSLAWVAVLLCAGTLVTLLTVIIAGLSNFHPEYIEFPPDAFRFDQAFAKGLGGAMLIAVYDYFGYYNVCHLGDEVIRPEKTIPRAVILSVLIVAVLYLTMNLAIIGVVPWQQAMQSKNIAAEFMEVLFGRSIAVGFTALILWTTIASTFVMTLGYSRILYAAAKNGDFFASFAYVHPRGRYPLVAILTIGILTAVCCFFSLQEVIEAAVVVRIIVQFLAQIIGLHLVRTTRPDIVLPFRMWLYPVPSILAAAGWLFVLGAKLEYWPVVLGVFGSGIVIYPLWRRMVAAVG
ncbi:MAG TPA: APC family permease [Pirellulales bacterium]|jgi:amino acid transporter|nr:APC family permease [Pirellulales bacterium]